MFVDRARVIGAGRGHIMRRHILPNVVNLIVAQAVLTFAAAVFTETTPVVHRPRRPVPAVVGPDPRRRPDGRRAGPRRVVVHRAAGACVVLVVLVVHARRQRPRRHPQPEVRTVDEPMTDPREELRIARDLGHATTAPTPRRPRRRVGRAAALEPTRTSRGRRPRPMRRRRDGVSPIRGRRQWPLPKLADPGRAAARGQGPQDAFQARVRAGSRRSTGSASGSTTARRWAWPASRAAARRPPRCRSSGSCPATRRIRGGSDRAVRDRPRAEVRATRCGATAGARSASSSRAR